MRKKRKKWLGVAVGIILFQSNPALAEEVSQVETNGTIQFTGTYEPIGTPDPKPPENISRPPIKDIAKPGGRLPQTNEARNPHLTWLGSIMLGFALILWKKRKNKIQP